MSIVLDTSIKASPTHNSNVEDTQQINIQEKSIQINLDASAATSKLNVN